MSSCSSSSIVETTPAPDTNAFMKQHDQSHTSQHQHKHQTHQHQQTPQDPHEHKLPDILGTNAFPDSTSDSSPDRNKIHHRRNQYINPNNNMNSNVNFNIASTSTSASRIINQTRNLNVNIQEETEHDLVHDHEHHENPYFMSEASQSEDALSSYSNITGSSFNLGSPVRYAVHTHANVNVNTSDIIQSNMPNTPPRMHSHMNNTNNSGTGTDTGTSSNNNNSGTGSGGDTGAGTGTGTGNSVVGGDIDIQMKKSASNTSLSSLGSPSTAVRFESVKNNPSFKRRQLFFNNNNTNTNNNSGSGSTPNNENNQQYQGQHECQLPTFGNLLGPLHSGGANFSITEAEERLRITKGNDSNDNTSGIDNDNDYNQRSNANANATVSQKDKNSGGSGMVGKFYLSPRREPNYIEDDNENISTDEDIDISIKPSNVQKVSISDDDDLSETDSNSQDEDLLNSIFSSSTRTLDNRSKKIKSYNDDQRDPQSPSKDDANTEQLHQQKDVIDAVDGTLDEIDSSVGLSYDLSSSDRSHNGNGGDKRESFEIKSPPKIENTIEKLAAAKTENIFLPLEEPAEITPKRKTTKITTLSESRSRIQRKRISSDGKRAPKHRRTKSGDDVAATLLTGSADWVGMELDKLPLPSQNDEDEDEDIESGMKGDENKIEESSSFGALRSEERANRRNNRRRGSDSNIRLYKDQSADAWRTIRDAMAIEDFSKYALSTVDVETGKDTFSSTVYPHGSKEPDHYNSTDSKPSSHSLRRHGSQGDASVDSHGSQGTNTSAFSWISNRISLLSHKDEGMQSSGGSEMFSGLDNSTHREPIYYSPIPEEVTSASGKTVGQTIDIREQQRKKAAIYDAHLMTMNQLPPGDYPLQPLLEVDDPKKVFICPRCKMKQREFFTVATVPKTFENPISVMIIYFVVYVVLALFIFGIEEGWPTLDCVYFSIMTLTTTGLGDYVPTTNSAKIVCSIFMYFGVGCFGLLLGVLHANSLDHASRKAAEENLINSCRNCSRERVERIPEANTSTSRVHGFSSPRRRHTSMESNNNISEESPLLERQLNSPLNNRRNTLHTIDERQMQTGWYEANNNISMGECDDHSEASSHVSTISLDEKFRPVSQIKAAKYIFLTLKQAFANTLFIIGIGSLGFFYFEHMTTVDAFYFTTSILTTVGYGDILPETSGGKLFCSGFSVLAWVFLLYNISMISMIPLELRKRRIEHAVLVQFGDELDDAALHELVSGPLVKRMTGMIESRSNVDDQCTREMFALTMLVRLGRITEQDVRSTFAAFQKLDKNNEGVLTSKQIHRRDGLQGSLDGGSLLPRQRQSNSSLSENSALQHPLTSTMNKISDERLNYMSMMKDDDGSSSRRLMRARGMSLESLLSNATEENWQDNP